MRTRVIKGKWDNVDYHFTEYKNDNFVKKPHLISVSLFFLNELSASYCKMKCMTMDFVKREYEKKKNLYMKGLDEIVQNMEDTNLRIYCDTSSLEVSQKYLDNEFVEVVEYDFPQLRDNYGFFGTLMRYIPLFNFSQFENKWKTVCVLDLDNSFIRSLPMINYFKENWRSNLAFWTRPCYYMCPRMFAIPVEPNEFSIISSFIIQRKQQDRLVFEDFLNEFILRDNEEYREKRMMYLGEEGSRLEYGVDEYFINGYFLQKCYYDMNKPFNVIMHRDVFGGVLEWLKYMRFMFPKVEITNENAVVEFMKECAKIFFPPSIKIPKKNAEEMMEWVGETFYETKMHLTERKEDQVFKMDKLAKILMEKRFDGMNLRNEMIEGLKKNCKIKFGNHGVFLVEPLSSDSSREASEPFLGYPRYKTRIVKTFRR